MRSIQLHLCVNASLVFFACSALPTILVSVNKIIRIRISTVVLHSQLINSIIKCQKLLGNCRDNGCTVFRSFTKFILLRRAELCRAYVSERVKLLTFCY